MPQHPAGTACLGVALPVPDPYGLRLQSLRAAVGDARARNSPAHVTLLPPMAVGEGRLPAVVDHLRVVAAQHPPFVVTLRGAGTFRPVSDVVYAAVEQGHAALSTLAQAVRTGPLHARARFPFHPHVTVAHNLPPAALDRAADVLASLQFTYVVASLCLYRHADNDVWQLEKELALGTSR